MKKNNFKKTLLCWGAADQMQVMQPIIEKLGSKINILVDDTPKLKSPLKNTPLLQGRSAFEKWLKGRKTNDISFLIAIGNPYGFVRCKLHDYLTAKGLTPVTICDSSALIDKGVIIGDGSQIMKGAIVNAHATIGRQCILNTGSIVEHHCTLEEGVEIGPGGVLCGRVHVGKNTWVAANTTVLPRLKIGANAIVGAGAVVTKDLSGEYVYTGCPAKKYGKNKAMKK